MDKYLLHYKKEGFFRGLKKMSILQEFKKFAMRGNVVDMAVGIIIGGAFGKIVSSFVGDVIMPPLGVLIGGVDFSDLVITLKAAADGNPAVVLAYGRFLQTVVDFLIISFAIFLAIKAMNKLVHFEAEKPKEPTKPSQEDLLMEIRDLLKEQNK